MAAAIQPFAPLDEATEAALRESIRRFGVIVPIVVDGNGRTIDGHHRQRLAKELGITNVPIVKRLVKNDDDASALAFSLNSDRRQLTADARREVVKHLLDEGYSLRAIGGVTGVSLAQTRRDVAKVTEVCTPGTPDENSTPQRPADVDDDGVITATSGSQEPDPVSGAAGSGDDETQDPPPASEPDPEPGPRKVRNVKGGTSTVPTPRKPNLQKAATRSFDALGIVFEQAELDDTERDCISRVRTLCVQIVDGERGRAA